jgi:hypothetical protein
MHKGWKWENLKQRDDLEEVELDGRIILKIDLKIIGLQIVNLIDLAQVVYEWRVVVNTVMKIRGFDKMRGIS